MKQFETPVGPSGRKLVIDFENGFTIQRVIDAKYIPKGKVDIHITYNSTLKGKGARYDDDLRSTLPKYIQSFINDNGGRVLKKHIVFGPQMVTKGAIANTLSNYMNMVELIAGQSK